MLGYGKIMRSFCANTEKFWRKISKNGSDRSAGALPAGCRSRRSPVSGTRRPAGSHTETKLTMAPQSPTDKYQHITDNLRHWLRMILI
jgi:hypothetical protein